MIVMKFGGTSTKDASAMLNVTEIVKSHLYKKPIVVISAIAQATNMLEFIANSAKEGFVEKSNDILNQFVEKHNKIIEEAIKNQDIKIQLYNQITQYKKELSELINGVAILRELTPKTLDRFYSYGELLSSLIISEIMSENGINTVWLDTKDFMITDSNYNRAQPIISNIKERLSPLVDNLMKESKIPVTQGFIGATITGDRTTMGRESSDYSASIIGAVLEVEDIQIWTDVDGVLTGDPNIVENPKKIRQLSFEEAYQLSFFGAKVLHPNTMLPAQEKDIPIHVFNSKRPDSGGTLVTDKKTLKFSDSILVKSVTYKTNITFLTIQPKVRFSPFLFWEQVMSVLNKYKITPLAWSTLEYMISVAIDSKFLCDSVMNELEMIGSIENKAGLSMITLVGQNLNKDTKIHQNVTLTLKDHKILFSNFGTSNYSFSLILEEHETYEAIRKLHQLFFDLKIDSQFFDRINK